MTENIDLEHSNKPEVVVVSTHIWSIITALVIAGILGGITLYSDQKVTSNALAEHKVSEEMRLQDLKIELRSFRDELRGDLSEIRQAVVDHRKTIEGR
jgi:hypothetical protein